MDEGMGKGEMMRRRNATFSRQGGREAKMGIGEGEGLTTPLKVVCPIGPMLLGYVRWHKDLWGDIRKYQEV